MAESIKISQELITNFWENNRQTQSNTEFIMLASSMEHASSLWEDYNLPYHNYQHSFEVAQRVFWLYKNHNDYYGIKPDEICDIMVAAFLHDIGYALGANAECHEEVAVRSISGYSNFVKTLIRDTKFGKEPELIQSNILIHADVLNWTFEFDEFFKYTIQVADEIKYLEPEKFSLFLAGTINNYIDKFFFSIPTFEIARQKNVEMLNTLLCYCMGYPKYDELSVNKYIIENNIKFDINKYTILKQSRNYATK